MVNRIIASGGGSLTSGGNLTLTNSATSNTILSIANNNANVVGSTPVINPSNTSGGVFYVGQITTTANSTDRFMIFTAGTSAFTVPAGGIVCDILMIGGGGAGGYGGNQGYGGGGGGGAGACIVALNQPLTAGVSISIIVGAGDAQSTTNTGTGSDSSISVGGTVRYLAKGGGRGERDLQGRNAGGCGGGTGGNGGRTGGLAVNTNMVNGTIVDANARSSTFAVFGNKGGDQQDGRLETAGGGGIGGVGGNHLSGNVNAGPGGVGLFQATVGGTTYNFRSYFANNGSAVSFGVLHTDGNYYIGGGGGGSVYSTTHATGPNVGGIGGVGGGGNGGIRVRLNPDGTNFGAQDAYSATANTGSGGGGGYYSDRGAGSGGSGIVIVRYRIAPPIVGVPFVELIRGISSDTNIDYKLGNYNGDFKIVSSVSNTDADRINITSTGNVGIGTSSPANELHIFDSTTSATSLIIQNNNMMITSNITQGTSTSTSTVTGTPVTGYSDGSFADNKPSVHEQVTSSTDRIMIFRTPPVNHTFTIPSGGMVCDILMIGGGGAGGGSNGGGAGACIVSINQTLPAGSCVVRVGAGGAAGGGATTGGNGTDSFIQVDNTDRYRAKGGGGGGGNGFVGSDGGCGGGAGYNNSAFASGGQAVATNTVTLNDGTTNTLGPFISNTHRFAIMGNAGGGNISNNAQSSGSGGGIGTAGVAGGNGGNGRYFININGTDYNFRNYFANGGNNFGVLHSDTFYYIGGGKPGYGYNNDWGTAGLGVGAYDVQNTGSGGSSYVTGVSGIIIIRYKNSTIPFPTTTTPTTTTYTHSTNLTTTLSTPTLGTPSIELVRGTQGDSNTDYKIGNYNGDFIVKSSVSNTDTDYLKILGTDGTIYNKPNSLYWNQISDRRIKENIMRASYDLCYENVDKLELNRFNYIKEFNTGNRDTNQLGFIAQEINEIFPKAVFTNNYNSVDLNIQDMLSIDIGQINFTLYGAVKKLMEINKDKEFRLKRLECLLNVEDSGDNVVIDSDISIDTSNIILDTSNITIDTSNIVIDTSNIILDTSNITIDTSNIILDTSNITIDTSNISIDTSNITIDTSNIAIDTSNI